MMPAHFPRPEDQIWTLVELHSHVRIEIGFASAFRLRIDKSAAPIVGYLGG